MKLKPKLVEFVYSGPGAGPNQRNVEVTGTRRTESIGYSLADVYEAAGLVAKPVPKIVLWCKRCDRPFSAHVKGPAQGLYLCLSGDTVAAAGVDFFEKKMEEAARRRPPSLM